MDAYQYGSLAVLAIGVLVLGLSRFVTEEKEFPIYSQTEIRTGGVTIKKPFRVQRDGTLKVTVNYETGNTWYLTDFFSGSDSDTSGPRYLENQRMGEVKLISGDYVFCPGGHGPFTLSVTLKYRDKTYSNWEIWGLQLITVGLALLIKYL
jgi:hypothetical protein